jgi:hypothetical protein
MQCDDPILQYSGMGGNCRETDYSWIQDENGNAVSTGSSLDSGGTGALVEAELTYSFNVAVAMVESWLKSGVEKAEDMTPGTWEEISGKAHLALTGLGFAPGVGAIPDGIDFFVYAAEGDGDGAMWAGISALPGLGDLLGLSRGLKILDDAAAATPVGRRSSDRTLLVIPGTNTPTTIGGRQYTGHALDRMQGQGIPPSVVDDTIRMAPSGPGRYPGTRRSYGTEVDVITGPDGGVITVYPNSGAF